MLEDAESMSEARPARSANSLGLQTAPLAHRRGEIPAYAPETIGFYDSRCAVQAGPPGLLDASDTEKSARGLKSATESVWSQSHSLLGLDSTLSV